MAYSPGPGPVGYIFHSTEPRKVLIHPDGGAYNPDNNTDLIITGIAGNPGRLQFRIDPKDGDEWGYIEHISSKKVVYPRGTFVKYSYKSIMASNLCYITKAIYRHSDT